MIKPEDLNPKDLQNIHKLVYLAQQYDKKTIRELGEMFSMTMLNVNATIWRARDLGYLKIDDKTGEYSVTSVPEDWRFGEDVEHLMTTLVYTFNKLAEQESDLEDQQLSQWCAGHMTHDYTVAMKRLIENRILATYEETAVVEMPTSKKAKGKGKKAKTYESTYTFYTLWKNLEQRWGRKQFNDQTILK